MKTWKLNIIIHINILNEIHLLHEIIIQDFFR